MGFQGRGGGGGEREREKVAERETEFVKKTQRSLISDQTLHPILKIMIRRGRDSFRVGIYELFLWFKRSL